MSSIRVNNLYDRHIFVRESVVRFSYFALILIHETRDFLIVYIASITCRSAEGSDPDAKARDTKIADRILNPF